MKADSTKQEDVFQPITLTITIESKKEAECLHGLFNASPLAGVMEDYGVDHAAIRNAIRKNVKNVDDTFAWRAFCAKCK